MKVYVYSAEKPQEGKYVTASYGYGHDFYLIAVKIDKNEREKLLQEIATYHVCESTSTVVDWDCDNSRSYDNDANRYIDVPTNHVIIKDGAFWGYRILSQSWSGGATSEYKETEWVVVSLDSGHVTVNYYSVTTSDYDKTRETTHSIEKRGADRK